ncbi:MAG TPA: bifunctional glutamate N-acetyltransferase/amino-acid acetyltransferase ArgJ [Clostridiales bacterium]|nr:bifunctional glutamate N-acetyltransferase/amino-acid acetyltransferase ArgJ [Clostridiales bacterium]
MIKYIDGSVTAPQGFTAGGICCSIKPNNKTKKDLAMIYCDTPCTVAGVYTQNLVKGAPILVTKKNISNGTAQAIIANSGNANTCNADGEEKAEAMCEIAGRVLNIKADDVIVASTGVIGQVLPIEPIQNKAQALADILTKHGGTDAAEAIMTTDTIKKEVAVQLEIDGKTVTLGGIAKGSGMIHINMATMLSFITTDAAISSHMLQQALNDVVGDTFNMISVDGDTSTNDTLAIMASGKAGNKEITEKNRDYTLFVQGLTAVCQGLAKKLAGDGEGATKLLLCNVINAKSTQDAKGVAKSVICSSLLKAAMFGEDANWGRVLCAIGYSGCDVNINKVDVAFVSAKGTVEVCKNGAGIEFSEDIAKTVLGEKEINININLNDGDGKATAYGCDLTYEYVKINGDYRT